MERRETHREREEKQSDQPAFRCIDDDDDDDHDNDDDKSRPESTRGTY